MQISHSKFSIPVLVAVAALAAVTGCAADSESSSEGADQSAEPTGQTSSALRIGGFGLEGDACTVRTNPDGTTVPGTEKGLECCSKTTPTDCVVILKPFPKAALSRF